MSYGSIYDSTWWGNTGEANGWGNVYPVSSTSTLINDILSYWNFDETSGDLLDQVGSNDGTVSGATQNVTGKIGTAYSFDGVNDLVDLGTPSGLNLSGEFGISLWYNRSGSGTGSSTFTGTLLSKWWDGSSRAYNLRISDSGEIEFTYRPNGDGADSEVTNTSASYLTGWHHVAVTYRSGTMYLYVDGSEVNSKISGSIDTNSANTEIGSFVHTSLSAYFNGYIDELGIWNRALTADEITELYNSGTGKTHPFT